MKKLTTNHENTVGELQFNDTDIITTIGTYKKDYLLEALGDWFTDLKMYDALTLGIYNSNGKRDFNLLCMTDGKQIICVAPIHDDGYNLCQPKFPRDELTLTEPQQRLIDELSDQINNDEKFKHHIKTLVNNKVV